MIAAAPEVGNKSVQIIISKYMDYRTLETCNLLACIAGATEACMVMERYPRLSDLARAGEQELTTIPGIDTVKAAAINSAFALAAKLTQEIGLENPVMDTPEKIAGLLREEFRLQRTETFHIVLLNTRRGLIQSQRISQGTLDTLLVHPREVFIPAIRANASAIILAHNHPSGDPSPSTADISITHDLIRAGQLLKIQVLDHVILGSRTTERTCDYCSLREAGYFND
jgi:DNA repair protein RadC